VLWAIRPGAWLMTRMVAVGKTWNNGSHPWAVYAAFSGSSLMAWVIFAKVVLIKIPSVPFILILPPGLLNVQVTWLGALKIDYPVKPI